MTKRVVKGYTKKAVTRIKFKKWCEGNAVLQRRRVDLYDAWLAKASVEYQFEKRAAMYDASRNGGKRYKKLENGAKAEWHNSGTPVEWVYRLEERHESGVTPWDEK